MPNTLDDQDWDILLRRIDDKRCTPFLGAGACFGVLPVGADIASDWAKQFHYPLEDPHNLASVAQFLAITRDAMFPKEELQRRFKKIALPDFNSLNEPHRALASLPIKTYITTNYDDFMLRALKTEKKDPKREVCRWNKLLRSNPSVFDSGFSPTVPNPLVFHLHGHTELSESMVLTEDDYLDFLIAISQNPDLLPKQIQEAFAGTSLLFLGYRLADWDFRVLFRSLVTYLEISTSRTHISVQLLPVGGSVSQAEKENVQKYFDRYFQKLEIRVYWGTCHEFIADLMRRWEGFTHG